MPNQESDKAASNIAKQMRTKGMNYVGIMRALFEASNSFGHVDKNASTLNQAIAIESIAANLHHDLETKADGHIRQLNALINDTKSNIDTLRTVKTSATMADNFQNDLKPFEGKVTEFDKKHKEYLNTTKTFITSMKEAFTLLAKDPNNRDAKKKIAELNSDIQLRVESARKDLMGESLRNLTDNIKSLNKSVAQAAVTATGVQPKTTPGLT